MGGNVDSRFHFSHSHLVFIMLFRYLTTHVLPGQSYNAFVHFMITVRFAMTSTNCSIDSSFADSSYSMSQSGSSEPAVCSRRAECSCHLEIHFLFPKCPSASSTLVCFASVGRSIHPGTLSSQESQDGKFLSRIRQRRYSSPVDICCPISGSNSTSCHLSRHTVVPHVLSPVFVLTFSVHLGTNDTARRNHRMSLDLHPRLSVCLSISTLLLSQAPLSMQIPQGTVQMSVYLTV